MKEIQTNGKMLHVHGEEQLMFPKCPYNPKQPKQIQRNPYQNTCGTFHRTRTNNPQVYMEPSAQFSSVQSLSHVQLFATPWTAAHQASLSSTNSWSSPKLMSIESVMPSSHLILCRPLLLLPPIPPSIRVFSMSQVFA